MAEILLFNKPYGVLSQFTDTEDRPTLAQWINRPGFYLAGRLDRDSEGLVVLTNDGALQQRISHPRYKKEKTYLLQVEGVPTARALQQLADGVHLKDGRTGRAGVRLLARKPAWLWPRQPPIRQRRKIPVSWIELVISEGKNRQVRRMTAVVGLPTLRLIRTSIGDWQLNKLQPGELQSLEIKA
ncbi:MAG: pseudouridine synthase [Xanthomonadales bacterium]|nr:pseudouridine synthase [Xanthomonadales bacterium]